MYDKEKSKQAKKFLKQAYRLNELINSHVAELQQLRALAESIPGVSSYDKVKIQGGSLASDAGVANVIAKIVDLERQIQKEMFNLVVLKKNIHDAIRAVPNADEQLVLRLQYIEFKTWAETAKTLNYSVKQVQRIHGNALQNVKILKYVAKCP